MIDLLLAASIPWLAALFLQGWRLLLFFQQEEYDGRRFLRWAGRRVRQLVPSRPLAAWLLSVLAVAAAALLAPGARIPALVLGWLGGSVVAALLALEIRRPAKIKLAYTLRLDRLLAALATVCALVVYLVARGLALAAAALSPGWAISLELLLFGPLLLAAPFWIDWRTCCSRPLKN
jgi:hypothetical protein